MEEHITIDKEQTYHKMVVSHGMDPTFLQPLLASVYTRMIRSDPNPRYTLCLGTNIMAVSSASMLNLQRVIVKVTNKCK